MVNIDETVINSLTGMIVFKQLLSNDPKQCSHCDDDSHIAVAAGACFVWVVNKARCLLGYDSMYVGLVGYNSVWPRLISERHGSLCGRVVFSPKKWMVDADPCLRLWTKASILIGESTFIWR